MNSRFGFFILLLAIYTNLFSLLTNDEKQFINCLQQQSSKEPKLFPFVKELSLNEGESITFTCSLLSGDTQPLNIEWRKDDKLLLTQQQLDDTATKNIKITYDASNETSKLRLTNITEYDDATYTCAAKNRFGLDKASTKLNVKVRLAWIQEPPDELTIGVGKRVSIACSARGSKNAQTSVQWNKVSHSTSVDLFNNNTIQAYDIEQEDNNNNLELQMAGNELILDRVSKAQSGLYECKVQSLLLNDEQILRKIVKLKVMGEQATLSSDTARTEHLNIVLIGHVDAGKSTTGGQILLATGVIDKRTAEKCRQEAKEKNHESWWLSWVLDLNPDERDKGKTIEVGRGSFTTKNKNFTLLDAPGHKGFVPNMICGACQADVAILVISARKGEFETGFERGGQTREHAMLAKTAGVRYMAVLINKMDDPTVEWSEERFKECRDKITPFLKKTIGFKDKELTFIPASSLTGAYIKDTAPDQCSWYQGPSLLDWLDQLPPINIIDENSTFIMPITGKYKDMGTIVTGKIESGQCTVGNKLLIMPNKTQVEIMSLYTEEEEVNRLQCGDNGRLKLKGVEEEEVFTGMVLCDVERPCKAAKLFDAQLYILETKSIICPGYSAVLHVHAATEEVKLVKIHYLIDKKSGEKDKTKRFAKQDQLVCVRLECLGQKSVCVEKYTEFEGRLSRFTLRDEGKTVAMGKVLQIVE